MSIDDIYDTFIVYASLQPVKLFLFYFYSFIFNDMLILCHEALKQLLFLLKAALHQGNNWQHVAGHY
jgi:hypothetical protein